MNIEQKQVGWSFWIWWTGLTIIGGLAGNYIADMLGLGMLSWPTDTGILFSMLGSGVFGLCVSAAQWILLRRMFPKTAWWLVAGTFGRAFGMLIGSMTIVIISNKFNLQAGSWSSILYLTVRGAVLGTSQWLIIKQWRTKAGWWVLANAIGWMLGSTLLDLFIPPTAIAPILGDLIAVAIPGAVTGAIMVWILRQPAPAPMKETGDSRLMVRWISVWAISWGVSWAVGWSVVRYVISTGYIIEGGKVGGMVAGGIAGLIGGVGSAIVLNLAKPSDGLKIYHLILIALGWAGIVFYDWLDGFIIAGLPASQNKYGIAVAALSGNQIKYGIGGPLSGIVGGILTALILLWAFRSLHWKQLCVIVIGWTAGFAIGGWIVWTIGFQIALNYAYDSLYGNGSGISSFILFTLISILGGAFAGWIGGAATLKQFSIKPSQISKNIKSTSKGRADKKLTSATLPE
jgi:hypothetical protein